MGLNNCQTYKASFSKFEAFEEHRQQMAFAMKRGGLGYYKLSTTNKLTQVKSNKYLTLIPPNVPTPKPLYQNGPTDHTKKIETKGEGNATPNAVRVFLCRFY